VAIVAIARRKTSDIKELVNNCSGLTDTALIREQEGRPLQYRLDREYRVSLSVKLPPHKTTWFVMD
jgi:hypothetical protein